MSSDLSKQEYLKRYLGSDDKEKKRKKKLKTTKSVIPRIKILDNDISIKSINFGTKEEVDEEEAPIVAEVIDERPVEVKSKEIYESSRWKRIGEDDSENLAGHNNASQPHPRASQHTNPKKASLLKNKPSLNTVKRHDSDSDLSPVRVPHRHDSDSDCSPPRDQRSSKNKRHLPSKSENDFTNTERILKEKDDRTLKKHATSHKIKNSSLCRNLNQSDSDLSPKRPGRQKSHANRNSDSDLSPERPGRRKCHPNKNSDSDLSPERPSSKRSCSLNNAAEDVDSDLSPPRKSTYSPSRRNSPSNNNTDRPMKTLSGLSAGLQNAITLREETKELRIKERTQIRQLDAELSGRNADTIVRDRQTGRKRDIDEEMRVKDQKEKKIAEQQQKYAEWGKGVEQTEDKKMKLSEDLYETSKPLARYCDDEDLEERLKAEIRDDDPMAQYMRKKKQKDVASAYPVYSGPPPPPNRFGIPPGYRWDGVDRSNGFEKKYFEQKSSKKAIEEEAYLWSIQDM